MVVINEIDIQIIDNQNHKKMKTKVLTIAAIIALAFGTVNLSNAAPKKSNDAAIVLSVSKINKIEVHGNVQVYVSDGSQDQVKVYNHYYSENALVQNENGTLRISSYKAEKLVVWVTANELQSISAYDNADVTSFGKLSEIELDVNLFNSASAKLNLDSYSANINVNDRAKAELTGTATECDVHYATTSTVNHAAFTADRYTQVAKNNKPVVIDELQELANL